MKAPIFIYEPGDLLVFETLESARSYLEPADVKNTIARAFDAEGRKLSLSVATRYVQRKVFGLFTKTVAYEEVVIDESQAQCVPNELKDVLIEFLSNPELPANIVEDRSKIEDLPLSELIKKAHVHMKKGPKLRS